MKKDGDDNCERKGCSKVSLDEGVVEHEEENPVAPQMYFIGDDDDVKEAPADQERADKWKRMEKEAEKFGIRPRRGRKWLRRHAKVEMLRGLD